MSTLSRRNSWASGHPIAPRDAVIKIPLNTCLLRSWKWGDETALIQYANNKNIWINMVDRFPHPYLLAHARNLIHLANSVSPVRDLAIEVEGRAAGQAAFLLHGDVYHRSAEVGYWLGEPYWGKGIMTEAIR